MSNELPANKVSLKACQLLVVLKWMIVVMIYIGLKLNEFLKVEKYTAKNGYFPIFRGKYVIEEKLLKKSLTKKNVNIILK